MSKKTYKLLAMKAKTDKTDYIKSKTFYWFKDSIRKGKESYKLGQGIWKTYT